MLNMLMNTNVNAGMICRVTVSALQGLVRILPLPVYFLTDRPIAPDKRCLRGYDCPWSRNRKGRGKTDDFRSLGRIDLHTDQY